MPRIFLPVGGLLLPPNTSPQLPCGKRLAQKQVFAQVSALESHLSALDLSDTIFWDYVKRSHKVESRSELSERDWVVLSARLFAVQKSLAADNEILFQKLISEIRATLGTCRAYRIHANATFRKIYDGIITADIAARCRRHADATGCRVRLHGLDGEDGIIFFTPEEFAPDPTMPPTGGESKPARAFEVRHRKNEKHHVEIQFPDVLNIASWGEQWAEKTGHTVHITDRMGHFVLMEFSPVSDSTTPALAPPSDADMTRNVKVDGQEWTLLNQWDDQWHWVKMAQSMERYIATANSRTDAVESLIVYIRGDSK